MKEVRTRIAPSPTGYPHIGTIYQALFNFAYAKKRGGKFIVRIEDTDRTRFVEGSEDVIFQTLDWVGLTEDESPRKGGEFGPYRQSERLSLYHEYAQKLVAGGHAYFSYYKKEDAGEKKEYSTPVVPEDVLQQEAPVAKPKDVLEMLQMENWILRMKVPKDTTITIRDEIRGEITFESSQVTDQVLLKSDGFPTYHFAVVIDDHLMQISQILRAEEWIPSTPKHVLLYKYFDWDMPPIYHTATLRNPDKSKLSKRHGHTNVLWFQEEGYLPEAILNFLALLGWTHPEEKEIFSLEEFISLFDFKDIRPVAPIFDLKKLEWMNGMYIRNLVDDILVQRLQAYDPSLKDIDEKIIHALVTVAKTRIKTLKEFKEMIMPFLYPQSFPLSNEEMATKSILREALVALQEWNKEKIADVIFSLFIQPKTVTFKELYMLLIHADKGLPLADTFAAIGKEKTLALL